MAEQCHVLRVVDNLVPGTVTAATPWYSLTPPKELLTAFQIWPHRAMSLQVPLLSSHYGVDIGSELTLEKRRPMLWALLSPFSVPSESSSRSCQAATDTRRLLSSVCSLGRSRLPTGSLCFKTIRREFPYRFPYSTTEVEGHRSKETHSLCFLRIPLSCFALFCSFQNN